MKVRVSWVRLNRFNDITIGVLKIDDGLERIADLSFVQLSDLKEELFDFASEAYKRLTTSLEDKFSKTLTISNDNSALCFDIAASDAEDGERTGQDNYEMISSKQRSKLHKLSDFCCKNCISCAFKLLYNLNFHSCYY